MGLWHGIRFCFVLYILDYDFCFEKKIENFIQTLTFFLKQILCWWKLNLIIFGPRGHSWFFNLGRFLYIGKIIARGCYFLESCNMLLNSCQIFIIFAWWWKCIPLDIWMKRVLLHIFNYWVDWICVKRFMIH